MRKTLFFVLVNLLVAGSLSGQTIFSDAIKLSKLIDKRQAHPVFYSQDSLIKVGRILKNYLSTQDSTYDGLKPLFRDRETGNPFLRPFFPTSGSSLSKFTSIPSAFQSIGGLDVSNIADGLARLIVERTKAELNAYFFDRFKEEMGNHVELKVLFSQTSQQLEVIGVKVYNYNVYLTGLREAFEQDLSRLFITLPMLLDDPKYATSFDQLPELRLVLKSSFYVVSQLNNHVHPGDIIHHFPSQYGKDKIPDILYSSIQLLDLFSQSLRSQSPDRYWIGQDSLSLLADSNTFRIYLGLIYQQMIKENKDIVFTAGSKTLHFKDVLYTIGANWNASTDTINQYKNFIFKFGENIERINTSLKAIKALPASELPKNITLSTFMGASLNLLDHAREGLDLPYIEAFVKNNSAVTAKYLDLYANYLRLVRNADNLYLHCSKRDYGAAVSDLWTITNTVFTKELMDQVVLNIYNAQKKALNLSYPTSAQQETHDYKKRLGELEKEKILNVKKNMRFKELLLKYGTFMASVSTAESSAEVKSLIESTALPAGSSRIKRESHFNVAVNSFVGFYSGHEYIKGIDNTRGVNNFSLSAPVGISFAWGGFRKNKAKAGWAVGGFVSVIDLGALASFRFGDDSTSSVSQVQLKQILAPGLFLSVGFPKTPFTLNLGAQVGPLLREVSATQNKSLDNMYWRIGASLVVDIPLYNLYNVEKKE